MCRNDFLSRRGSRRVSLPARVLVFSCAMDATALFENYTGGIYKEYRERIFVSIVKYLHFGFWTNPKHSSGHTSIPENAQHTCTHTHTESISVCLHNSRTLCVCLYNSPCASVDSVQRDIPKRNVFFWFSFCSFVSDG